MGRLRRLIRERKSDLLFLSETKLKGVRIERLKHRLGFGYGMGVQAEGRSGGLYLAWSEEVEVIFRSKSKGHIDVEVCDNGGRSWRFTGFYGESSESRRHLSWELL